MSRVIKVMSGSVLCPQSTWLTGQSESFRSWMRELEHWNRSSAKSQMRLTTECASCRLSSTYAHTWAQCDGSVFTDLFSKIESHLLWFVEIVNKSVRTFVPHTVEVCVEFSGPISIWKGIVCQFIKFSVFLGCIIAVMSGMAEILALYNSIPPRRLKLISN